MSNIKCPKCENECGSTSKFCTKCGAEISIQNDSKLKGVGGWLIVVIFGLIYTLYNQGVTFYTSLTAFTNGSIEQLSNIQGLAGAVAFELIASFFVFILALYLLYLIRKQDKKFPKLYIKFLIAITAYIFLDTTIILSLGYPNLETRALFAGEEGTEYISFAKTLASSLIWGAYMLKSRRVKLTFTK